MKLGVKAFTQFFLPLIAFVAMSGTAQAQSKLEQYREGTQTELTAEQNAMLANRVKNIQESLQALLDQSGGVSLVESKRILLNGVRKAVDESQGQFGETLSRYVLNRSILIIEMMEATPSQSLDQEVAILIRAAKLAVRYANADLAYLNQSTRIVHRAQFGVEFAEYLLAVNESTLDAQNQLDIGLFAIRLLASDLALDAKKQAYASAALYLNQFAKAHPSLSSERDLNKTYRDLRLTYKNVSAMLQETDLKSSKLNGMTAIAIGPNHACAIIQGNVVCWGSNSWGQLGNGTKLSSDTPVQVLGVTNVTGIAVGDNHSCAISEGQVYCWGFVSQHLSPYSVQSVAKVQAFAVVGMAGVTAIAAAGNHTCAIARGLVYCFGENFGGVFPDISQHGFSVLSATDVPVQFPGAKNVRAIAVSRDHLCLLTGNTVLCAGNAELGGLGRDIKGDQRVDKNGVKPLGLGKSDMLIADGNQTCVSSVGKIICWGGSSSQLRVVGSAVNPLQSTLTSTFHCTQLNGMGMCWDENQYRATVADTALKINDQGLASLEAIQALELGVGTVSTVASNEHGLCAIVNLATGNQQVYCGKPGAELKRMLMFETLKITAQQNVASPFTIDPAKMTKRELEDFEIFNWYRHNQTGSDGNAMTYEDYRQRMAPGEFERKIILDLIKKDKGETARRKNPAGCAAKRAVVGVLTQGFFGHGDCPF